MFKRGNGIINKRKENKKRLSYLVIFCMIFTLIPVSVFAAEATDIANHWAKDQIEKWMDKNLIKGYPDGTFKPDNNITRAEFMVLVNGAFDYTETAEIGYPDVADTDWFADAVRKAKAAGYISGYADGTMKPNNPISREEAAAIIAKIKNLEEDSSEAGEFSDSTAMSWSKGAVGAVSKAAIMSGYPDGSFKPKDPIKRAEAVVALEKALQKPADPDQKEPDDDSIVYDKPGTYGPAYEQETVEKDVIITAAGVTLRNMVIEGDLIISESVEDGEVHLKGVTVEGDTIVNGGGMDSIYFENSVLVHIIVNKTDGEVRIVVSGTTKAEQVTLQSGAKLEEKNLTGEGFETVEIERGLPEDSKVTLLGEFETVDIKAAAIAVEIPEGTVQNLQVDENAENTEIEVARESEIIKMVIDAVVKVVGKGSVKEAEVNAKNVTFEKAPEKSTGTETPKADSASGGGGGGGSSKPKEVAVSAISVTGEAIVGATLTAKVTPDKATVNYQWQASADEGATWDDIADATSKTYLLSENEEGKLIRVKVTGTGNYTGTKISDPVGPVTVALKEVVRADGDVTQDTGFTGGKNLEYDFVAKGKVLTIDANNSELPYYEVAGTTPPRGANWVGVAIPVPADVETDKVSATINNVACTDLFFADGKYMEYIDVKDADLSEGAATYTWVIKWGSGYADETITVKLINVTGLEAPEVEPEPANLVATGSYGIHDNKVYAGYKLQDEEDTQISLIESNIESISVKDPDGNVTELTVVGETDPYLWFNIAKKAGTYTYTVVTKGEDAKIYKATLTWTAPTEAKVSFQAPDSAKDVFTKASDDAPAQVDFSKVTADKLLDWTSVKDGYYAIELKIEGLNLSEENVKYAFRVYGDGTAIEPEIKGDLDCQYVTTDWELGTATMYYVLADGSLYQAKINVVSLTPADEPAPEVKGSIERDPANTGGELEVTIEDDTVTFTSGEIKWYPADEELGRAAGNRVGVQINAPADFDTTGVTVKIGEQTYNWDEIEDGDGYFWWYPLVTEAGQQFTATAVWNESSTQEFKVVIVEGVTLEVAPDTTAPELKSVSPEAGDINLEYGETFKLEVTAYDENLRELEVDHNISELPEFSVYASEDDPYGGQEAAFEAQGVEVTYDADAQKWTIDFGETVTAKIVEEGGITFYLVLVDEAGNKWGSMDPTTPENTFAYTVTQDEAPVTYLMVDEATSDLEKLEGLVAGDTVDEFGLSVFVKTENGNTAYNATAQLVINDPEGKEVFNETVNLGDIEPGVYETATFNLSEVELVEGTYEAIVTLDADNQEPRTLDAWSVTVEAAPVPDELTVALEDFAENYTQGDSGSGKVAFTYTCL